MESSSFYRNFKLPLLVILLSVYFQAQAESMKGPLKNSCVSPQAGLWFDLNSLNTYEFTKDCQIKFQGANCSSLGRFISGKQKKGQLSFYVSEEPENSTCLSKGEHTCKYHLKGARLLLDCSPNKALNLVSGHVPSKNSGNKATINLLKNQRHTQLKEHLEGLSNEWDVQAISALGYNYFYGSRGFDKNYAEALYWNRHSATRGVHQSQILTGMHYFYGLGTEKDLKKAEEFFLLAAQNRDIVPVRALAGIYLIEKDDPANKAKAIKWLKQAVDMGDKKALEFLDSLEPEEKENLMSFCTQVLDQDGIDAKQELESCSKNPELESEDSLKALNSVFHVRPYFLKQENQGAVPSVAIGVTPGVSYKKWGLRSHATVSMLNLGITKPFLAFEISLMLRYTFETTFFELGGGTEFWTLPGGPDYTATVAFGWDISTTDRSGLSLKNISVGYAQSFFDDRVHKIFVGVGF